MTKFEAQYIIHGAVNMMIELGVKREDIIMILQDIKVQQCQHAEHLEVHKSFQQHIERNT